MSIDPRKIKLLAPEDTIFSYEGIEYETDQSQSEIKREIAAYMGDIKTEMIDHSVYEGSPYISGTRSATAADIDCEMLKEWLSKNKNLWKISLP